MVIHHLNVFGIGACPAKADAKLIVHTDAVLTGPAALQGFETVAGRNAEVVDPACDLQLPQLAPRYVFNLLKALNPVPAGEGLGVGILEGYDHLNIVTHGVINVKRDGWRLAFRRCGSAWRIRSSGPLVNPSAFLPDNCASFNYQNRLRVLETWAKRKEEENRDDL